MRRTVIQHPSQFQHYNYLLGVRFDPGAEAEAFLPANTNPVFKAAAGVGKLTRVQLRATQHPQVWFNPQMGVAGIPTQAGQLFTQPLSNE